MFKKILIANRGEIACRIMRTARRMGIHTVAIYSVVDDQSLHVKEADEAFFVGEAPAQKSYLHIESIIEIAKRSQVEAIHPGYGFLSENSLFASACEEAGLIFIGPSPAAMDAMASKQLAKQYLEKTAVPLTPGYHGQDQSDKTLLLEAERIGFPVLLKAASGGGGKGMRAVSHKEEFFEALASARRESMASFADDTMLIEKLLINPRHVEIQIMADSHGQVVSLFERDCSIQRRHQKIIEEAPAPNLSTSLREKLAQAACEVARSIAYQGAGTVEFLVDEDENFYFMEMNTRLQVEHPVTEMITGLDLVEWQLKIAAGERLPVSQSAICATGHAIECRIYAEDPSNHFIPSIGQIDFLKEPTGVGIRVDSGVSCHSRVTQYYDPMIAKLITWGEDREQALQRMQDALAQYRIGGIKTNIPFLKAIAKHSRFKRAQLGTDFLDREILEVEQPHLQTALLMAVGYQYLNLTTSQDNPLLKDCFAWQMHLSSYWSWHYLIDENIFSVKVIPLTESSFKLIGDEERTLNAYWVRDVLYINDGNQIRHSELYSKEQELICCFPEGSMRVKSFNWQVSATQNTMKKNQLTAPMPATVVAILKKKGDKIKEGESLMVLEAMKMEHTIYAHKDGVLKDLFFDVGAQVKEGVELMVLEPNP